MEARAIARGVRVSTRKTRLVVDLVRGKSVENALQILEYTGKKAAKIVQKTILSAMHNLGEKSDHPIEPADMRIEQIFVDEGRTMYRIRPRAQGRAYRIRKRSSHITVIISDEVNRKKLKIAGKGK
ncbi:MAG: 50S ribosomal protein L22 [Candidatus Krumholzibacteriota bacterium]|nr:50S ribosomal protein L22 [Candidatus Krumholzibacteriota bacterium]